MAETIQTFVDKIRTEGVQAGQKQADELLAKARQEAQDILSRAEQEKQRLVAEAETHGQAILARAKTEMKLACRDSALRLRDALNRGIQKVLAKAVKDKLTDAEFVGKLLSDIVLQYAQADIDHQQAFQINVPKDIREKLVDWAVSEIGHDTAEGVHTCIDLTGTLAQAGFEYNATGATVEVTQDSVVAALSELVSPRLGEMLGAAMASGGSQDG